MDNTRTEERTATSAGGRRVGALGVAPSLAGSGLPEQDRIQLGDQQRAARVSNLRVLLCSDTDVQPIINPGTLCS